MKKTLRSILVSGTALILAATSLVSCSAAGTTKKATTTSKTTVSAKASTTKKTTTSTKASTTQKATNSATTKTKYDYTISFKANGGTGAPASIGKNYKKNVYLPKTVPNRKGYIFKGWATSPKGAAVYKPGDKFTQNKSVVLYAAWEKIPETYEIKFYNGSIYLGKQTKTEGKKIKIACPEKAVRKGYTFKGWSLDNGSDKINYVNGSEYTKNEPMNLFAVWQINTYNIYYYSGTRTNPIGSKSGKYNQTVTLDQEDPQRNGYIFLGWSTKINATTADSRFNSGRDYTFSDESITLYAVWKSDVCEVKYDMNGGTGTIAKQTGSKNSIITVTYSEPTKAGYTFLGWSTNKNAVSAEYKAGSNFELKNTSTTLYAVWAKI